MTTGGGHRRAAKQDRSTSVAMDTTAEFNRKYLESSERSRERRLTWFREARFGMFVHWGLYSQIGRNEWAMNLERIPLQEYERLAATWKPKPGFAREWAALARRAGMKYMVLTTKHHDGFCLWDTKMTDYNAVRHGPGRDLVAEYVEAARAEGLKVGFYHSLMDWHHPDGIICRKDEAARRRFVEYLTGCVRELLTNYGRIDILWYDVSWPLNSPEAWDSYRRNALARKLQPHIIINDRSQLPEDFGTPEEHITPATGGRMWEACMTFNGSWGWQKTPPEDWHSARKVIEMLRICTANGGNLLLNIGPHPDGSVPREAVERLDAVGRWVETYGGVMAGKVAPATPLVSALGNWTRKGRTLYFWCSRWPGKTLALAAIHGRLAQARVYPDGKPLPFTQDAQRIVVSGLPAECPDKAAQVGMIEMKFRTEPRQYFNAGPVLPDVIPAEMDSKWTSPFQLDWQVSKRLPLPKGGIAAARALRPREAGLHWAKERGGGNGFVSIHDRFGDADGMVWLAQTVSVAADGRWTLFVGHDGGVKVFLDGRVVLTEAKTVNPSVPGRSQVELALAKGRHRLAIAFDLAAGRGWGIFVCWGVPASQRRGRVKPAWPRVG